jgi:hypothetical protein
LAFLEKNLFNRDCIFDRRLNVAYREGLQNCGPGLPKRRYRCFLCHFTKDRFSGILFVITSGLNGNENIGQFTSSQNTRADYVLDSLCYGVYKF